MIVGGTIVRNAVAVAVVAAAALIAPSVASAGDFYVAQTAGASDANPCTQALPCATIQHVAAAVAQADDTVHIGPGLYAEGVSAGTKRLTFAGAGAGAPDGFDSNTDTLIRPSTGNDYAIRMFGGGAVRDMKVEGSSAPPAADNHPALLLSAVGAGGTLTYTVENVIATGGSQSGNREKAIG